MEKLVRNAIFGEKRKFDTKNIPALKTNVTQEFSATVSLGTWKFSPFSIGCMKTPDKYHLIEERIEQLGQWLADSAPYVEFDQMHLESGTPEQAYWHLGYRSALADFLVLIKADGAGCMEAIVMPDALDIHTVTPEGGASQQDP